MVQAEPTVVPNITTKIGIGMSPIYVFTSPKNVRAVRHLAELIRLNEDDLESRK